MCLSVAHPLSVFTLLVVALSARGEPDSPSRTVEITLDEAIARTLKRSPELAPLEHRLDALQGRIEQAGLSPHPELAVALEDVVGSSALSGLSSAEATLSIAWVLERGARQRRVAAARAEADLSAVDAEIMRLDLAAETARHFLVVLANQARAQNADEAVIIAKEAVRAVQRRVRAGRAPQADLARAQAEHAAAKLVRYDIGHELTVARHRLAAQWGRLEPDFAHADGDLFAMPVARSLAELRQQVEQNSELARYMSQQRLAEAELRLAQAESKPPWQIRVGVRRLEASDDQALVAGLTMPLTVRNRNQGRIAEARAKIEKTRASAAAARVRIETTLLVLYEGLQNGVHRADTLGGEVIPLFESALVETRAAYELGRYDYMQWRTVQFELIEARRELIEACAEAHRNVIEIERLTGVRVSRSATSQQ